MPAGRAIARYAYSRYGGVLVRKAYDPTPAGKLRYLITDASGTPVALLSATGTVRAQYAWEPYGQVVAIDP